MLALTLAPLLLLGSTLAVPAPIPNGGVGVRTNDTAPVYGTMTDFDYESLKLGLYQEWIELDLFNYGVARFSAQEFADAGLNAEDISLIQFMAQQEVGHATLITNMINNGGRQAPKQCTYKYDFTSVREYVAFCQRLTRWGESGVYGFLSHLDSRPVATLLTQSITTEARQQMVFRQFSGAHPFPVHFETGISQSMAWSLLNRYIVSCPAGTPKISWPSFPLLNATNQPSILVDGYKAAITHNRTSLTQAGRNVTFSWEAANKTVSADGGYNTTVGGQVNGTQPKFVAWINQLNVTYTPLTLTSNYTGYATQPGGVVFDSTPTNGVINGTSFIGLSVKDLYVTPYNLSLLNDYLVAFNTYQSN